MSVALSTTETIALMERAELAYRRGENTLAKRSHGETEIVIDLGPMQYPRTIYIPKSRWPTVTALNFAEGKEFHMRLRQHTLSGIYIVYGSATQADRTVIQRGRICETLDQVKAAVDILRRELGVHGSHQLPSDRKRLPP